MFAVVVVALLLGVGTGLLSGWLAVYLEKVERLQQEEAEEREAYLSDPDNQGESDADFPGEHYGWTWIERYFLPALTGIVFALFAAKRSLDAKLIIDLLWIAMLAHIVAFDLKHRLILNRITYPAVLGALTLSFFTPGLTPLHAVIGAAVVYLFFLIQNLLLPNMIGRGDAKLGAFIGAITGLAIDWSGGGLLIDWTIDWNRVDAANAVISGILLGGVAALFLLLTRLRNLKDPIPYAPFLCAGAALTLYSGL
jgi:prepilin signal peptidase PulO-like enzyme (type II secretory pathway)